MFGLSSWELLAVLVIALLLFGSRLPTVMRSLGKSVTEFKRGMNDITEEQPVESTRAASKSPAPAQNQSQNPPQNTQG